MKYLKLNKVIIYLLFSLIFWSCNDSSSSLNSSGQINITIKNSSSNNSVLGKTAAIATITEARVVIEKIKFESSIGDSLDFRLKQPFIQNLVVDSILHKVESIQVPFGSYKEMEIEIDKLNPEDGDVYTHNLELQNKSILVKGFLTGDSIEAFVFTSDIEAEQEMEFDEPLVLDENSPSTNIVITIDMSKWFLDKSGAPLDPRLSENRRIIEHNIKASINAFEDCNNNGEHDDGDNRDHDGEDDHHHDYDDGDKN